MQLDKLVDAMEDAATVDLRGDKVLPWALEVIGDEEIEDGEVADAVDDLREWEADGAHRRDLAGDDEGNGEPDDEYEHSDAIAVMDAWWPGLVEGQFEPTIGEEAFDAVEDLIALDDPPNTHQGSSYIAGWYSFVEKDLRSVLEEEEESGERSAQDDEGSSGEEGEDPPSGDGDGADSESSEGDESSDGGEESARGDDSSDETSEDGVKTTANQLDEPASGAADGRRGDRPGRRGRGRRRRGPRRQGRRRRTRRR